MQTSKDRKSLSAHNEQGNMKRFESFSIRISKGRTPISELVLLRRGLPSEIALQGEASSPKLCIDG